MACCLFGAESLSESMLPYCLLDPKEYISIKSIQNSKVHSKKYTSKYRMWNGGQECLQAYLQFTEFINVSMHLFHIHNAPFITNVHISDRNDALWDMEQVNRVFFRLVYKYIVQ